MQFINLCLKVATDLNTIQNVFDICCFKQLFLQPRRSQHSQECKNTRLACFCNSRLCLDIL